MSYNWKCCSFYPNNFDASALRSGYDNLTVPFAQLSASFQTTIEPSRTAQAIIDCLYYKKPEETYYYKNTENQYGKKENKKSVLHKRKQKIVFALSHKKSLRHQGPLASSTA